MAREPNDQGESSQLSGLCLLGFQIQSCGTSVCGANPCAAWGPLPSWPWTCCMQILILCPPCSLFVGEPAHNDPRVQPLPEYGFQGTGLWCTGRVIYFLWGHCHAGPGPAARTCSPGTRPAVCLRVGLPFMAKEPGDQGESSQLSGLCLLVFQIQSFGTAMCGAEPCAAWRALPSWPWTFCTRMPTLRLPCCLFVGEPAPGDTKVQLHSGLQVTCGC